MSGYRDLFPEGLRERLPRAFDVVGDICIIKLPEEFLPIRKSVGSAILKTYKHMRVVCIDGGVTGDQRVRDLEIIAGERRTETEHRENGCRYRLDVAQVYFSPRLSGERALIASLTGRGESVWDMFCGVGPFSIPIAKAAREVCASDINENAIRYLRENMKLNRVKNIDPFCGDARDAFRDKKFDRVVMNLPHCSLDFLDCALERCGGGTIHLYRICRDPPAVCKEIKNRAQEENRVVEGIDVRKLHGYSVTDSLFCFDIRIG